MEVVQRAMQQSKSKKFLIDGFLRNRENLAAAEKIMNAKLDFVLFFYYSEAEIMRRGLNRNQINAERHVDELFEAVKSVSKFKNV